MQNLGASLSIKQCRNFGIGHMDVLNAAIKDLGLKRFRLMSYWDEIEKVQGKYDFSYLDAEVKLITKLVGKKDGQISLCLGARQPRWPESHWPKWTQKLSTADRNQALLDFINATVKRYQNNSCIVSWQLENEALLKNFGVNGDFDRARLRRQYNLVKQLDPSRPVIMTTSTSWGIPIRRPIPDIVGFSFYRITHNKGDYRKSVYQPWLFKLRARTIRLLHNRPSFIHELQAEPWGPKNIWEMSSSEAAKSMNPQILKTNLGAAKKAKLKTIDLWGLEWWYWLKQNNQPEIWETIKQSIN